MLDDALRQLDELFLLVIVGEFNSGKSSVINALLGSAFLQSGILPTTNEISVLKASTDGSDSTFRDQVSITLPRPWVAQGAFVLQHRLASPWLPAQAPASSCQGGKNRPFSCPRAPMC